ncbi:hypothetical protein EV693_10249 [Nicoletella semolina]|uniref:Uncharacterized protein n=1 Tax=Nicoletella semolina TaxID=271160 RepID=A0A4R2NBD3_9PAST|nr:hypothetical protein [Nicoletella semolina]TCP18370.1 hypothetical protein EV693_10249 [Nicoletella semolina]
MKTPKEVIKITVITLVIILAIISLSYALYFSYAYYFDHAFQPQEGIARLIYIFDIFMFMFLLAGTTYYIRLLIMLLSVIIGLFK